MTVDRVVPPAVRGAPGAAAVALGCAASLFVTGCTEDPAPELISFALHDGEAVDFSTGTPRVAAEAGEDWDLKLDGWDLFLHGGETAPGRGGGIDMELLDLDMRFEEMERRNQVLWFLFYDSYACAISDWWWYALDGTHTLFSNHHLYVVRRGDEDWAVQVLDYYTEQDGAAVAGWPEMRVRRLTPTPGEVQEFEVDATAGGLAPSGGPEDRWTYIRLPGEVLDLDDTAALGSADWDIAWKRFQVKSNSGPSGPGAVETVDFDRERGESGDDVLAFTEESERQWFEDRAAQWDPLADEPFQSDSVRPVVRRWFTGRPGRADDPPVHDPDRWFLVVDRAGEEVYKLRVHGFDGEAEDRADEVRVEIGLLP